METGGKRDERDDNRSRDNGYSFCFLKLHVKDSLRIIRDDFDDPDDQWDFGTMRHVGGQGTIGRVAPVADPIQEEVVYEVEETTGRNGSSHSGGSSTVYAHNPNGHSSSSTLTNLKTELPPVPPAQIAAVNNVNKALPTPRDSRTSEDEGTVRRMLDRRDPSYGSDDSEELRQDLERAQLSTPPPPTMLDSVVLPAIASVRGLLL